MTRMRRSLMTSLCVGLLGMAAAARTWAEVKVPSLFSDNMVLQQGVKCPVWGTAAAGEEVTVTIGDQTMKAMPGEGGKWMVRLDPLPAGGPLEMQIRGQNTIAIKNVLVGEVWVCSGQSNMAFRTKQANDAQKEAEEAKYPQIRMFTVALIPSPTPAGDVKGSWVVCSPEKVGEFSAVGYFFGRDLHKDLGVPVGLINTSWGGTPAEAWTPAEVLAADPDLKGILANLQRSIDAYPKTLEAYKAQHEKWKEDAEKAKAEGKKPAPEPRRPAEPGKGPSATYLWNGMVYPLVPYAIKGVIWYQGESNAGRAMQYRTLFPAMIKAWRQAWGQGDFPFIFVQLANFHARTQEPVQSGWAELREAQLMTLSLPNTGMAVIIDIGDAGNIHPKNKQDVGRRLELIALRLAYGKDLVYSGPMFDGMKVENGKAVISFRSVGGGLEAKGGEPLKGFAIAGKDGKFVAAQARIEGDKVVVSAEGVAEPAAVRYGWADNPDCNLYNKEGLPASPFRTDVPPTPAPAAERK